MNKKNRKLRNYPKYQKPENLVIPLDIEMINYLNEKINLKNGLSRGVIVKKIIKNHIQKEKYSSSD